MKKFAGVSAIAVAGVSALGTLWMAVGHGESAPPTGLQVKFENDRVRVLELRLRPGERERQHSHPQYVLYALTDYRVRNTKADGTTQVFERKAGDVYWGEPITHGGENIGTTELRAVIVELKPTRAP
jgi:beta-alanine degradation protein BauB